LEDNSGESKSIGCSSFNFANEKSPPLVEISVGPVTGDFEDVQLEVILDREELSEMEATVVNVYNPYDEGGGPIHTVPIAQGATSGSVSGSGEHVTKRTTVGTAPTTGEYRVVVENDSGTELAFERFSFQCERSTSTEEGT
jgi:hypothetical protein